VFNVKDIKHFLYVSIFQGIQGFEYYNFIISYIATLSATLVI